MTKKNENNMDGRESFASEDALEGARRATGDASSDARRDVEVVAMAKRRQFSGSEKRRLLAAADRCTQPGELGALLRRDGIYSSNLTTWRRQQAATERASLEPKKRGRKVDPVQAEMRKIADLTRENDRLRRKLAQAHTIIDVQKKLCTLLGIPADETPNEDI